MNANKLRKKNKVNGLNPTYRNKMYYINSVIMDSVKHCVSLVNWKPYTLIAHSGWLQRANNEVD
jgi:hypothetical protein